jgi:hypothetical protein
MRTRQFGGAVLAAAAAAALAGGAGARAGPVIRVSQESSPGDGDFDSHVLGYVTPFDGGGDAAAAFYMYNTPAHNVSYGNSMPTLAVNRSHVFFVNAADGLALFVVHDKSTQGASVNNGGGAAHTQFDLLGGSAGFLVQDDPPPSDHYTANLAGTEFTADQVWVSPNADGLVLGPFNGDFTLFDQFLSFSGLTDWAVLSGDGSDVVLDLADGRRVRLDVDPVPEPSALALLALGGLGLAGWRRLGRRKRNKPA